MLFPKLQDILTIRLWGCKYGVWDRSSYLFFPQVGNSLSSLRPDKYSIVTNNLAKLGDGLDESPTVMVGDNSVKIGAY